MSIRVVVDSGSDITKELANKYNIDVLPILVNNDEGEYRDGVDIDHTKLYEGMKNGVVYRTSQVSYGAYYTYFKECVENDEAVVYIALSSGISGSYQSSVLAREKVIEEYPDSKIHIIDSLGASFGISLIAIKIRMLIERGMSLEELLENAKLLIKSMEYLFTVDTMEYLYRGGRVTKTQKVVGGLLNIKPLLEVNKIDGKLKSIDKARGLKQVFKKMVEQIKERSINNEVVVNQTVSVVHSDCEEKAIELKEMMIDTYGIKDVLITPMGCTIGAHTGPGCIALYFINEGFDTKIDIIN